MTLSREDVLHIAHLARLGIDDSEVDRFASQLSAILYYFATLQALDTTGVEPTANPIPLVNVMREDVVTPSLPRDAVLANAPETEDGLIRVRAVLE